MRRRLSWPFRRLGCLIGGHTWQSNWTLSRCVRCDLWRRNQADGMKTAAVGAWWWGRDAADDVRSGLGALIGRVGCWVAGYHEWRFLVGGVDGHVEQTRDWCARCHATRNLRRDV